MTSFSDVNIMVKTAKPESSQPTSSQTGVSSSEAEKVTSMEMETRTSTENVTEVSSQSQGKADAELKNDVTENAIGAQQGGDDSRSVDDVIGPTSSSSRDVSRGAEGSVRSYDRVNSKASVTSCQVDTPKHPGSVSGKPFRERTASEARRQGRVATQALIGLPSDVISILTGMDHDSATRTSATSLRMLRLYVIANPSDLTQEGAWLRQTLVPSLRHWAGSRGFHLDVMDPHWPPPSGHVIASYVIAHQGELRRSLHDVIRNTAVPTVALVLLGEKLGTALPADMTSETLDDIISRIDDVSDQNLVRSHYRMLRNSSTSPSVHRLRAPADHETYVRILSVLQRVMTSSQAAHHLRSAIEDDLTWLLAERVVPPENVILCGRVVEGQLDPSHALLPVLFDVIDDRVDDVIRDRLRDLRERLHEFVPESHWLVRKVTWDEATSGEDEMEAKRMRHQSGCDDVIPEVRRLLEETMSRIVANMTTENAALPFTALPTGLAQELALHATRRQQLIDQSCPPCRQGSLEQIQRYLATSDDSRPLLLAGPPGSGRSTLCAHAWKHCMTDSSNVTVAVRFLGNTPDSGCVTSALLSLRHQLQYVYSSDWRGQGCDPVTLAGMMGVATETRPLVVVIDGVTQDGDHASLDWLPSQLPPHCRLLVSMDSDLASKLPRDTVNVLELPPLTEQEAASVLEAALRTAHVSIESRDIPSIVARMSNPQPLLLSVTSHLLLAQEDSWDSSEDGEKEEKQLIHPESLSHAVDLVLDQAERNLGQETVRRYCCWLAVSVGGLADHELSDLASCDDSLLHDLYRSLPAPVPHRAPAVTWYALRSLLSPLLRMCSYRGAELTTWSSPAVGHLVRDRYLRTPGTLLTSHSAMADYFSGRWAEGKGKPYSCPLEGVDLLKDRHVLAQPIRSQYGPNPRRLLELPVHILAASGPKDAFRCLGDPRLLADWMEATSLAAVLQFLVAMTSKVTGQDLADVTLLHEALSLSAHALLVSPEALFDQLPARLAPVLQRSETETVSERLRSLCDACEAERIAVLVPDRPVLRCVRSEAREVTAGEAFAGLFPLHPTRQSTPFLAATRPDQGVVQVVSVERRAVVRTLRGLGGACQLSVLDSRRAVILCGRELLVVDLDAGVLQAKLKGVLSLKSPLFSAWGDNSVVILSRNRMSVNVIDVQSGDMLVTFKVGENRFLTSLLLSKEGDIMVCGEEGEKGALLVWRLRGSRLLHDLRVPQHSFLPHSAALSPDGKHLVCVCQEMDARAATLVLVWSMDTGHVTRRWRSDVEVTSVGVACTAVVALLQSGDLQLWNLTTGVPIHRISGVHAWHNRKSIGEDGRLCVTYFSGQSRAPEASTVCLWDLQQGSLLTFLTFDLPPTCCLLTSDRGDMVVSLPGEESLVFLSLKPRPSTKSANHERGAGPASETPSQDQNTVQAGDNANEDDVTEVFGDPQNEGMVFDVLLDS